MSKTKTFKEYYQDPEFREKHQKYMATKVTCECGAVTSRNNMYRHKTTKKHKRYLKGKADEYSQMKKKIKQLNKELEKYKHKVL